MKKKFFYTTLIVCTFFSLNSMAQATKKDPVVKKGSFLAGMDFLQTPSGWFSLSNLEKSLNLTVSPNLSYGLKNNLSIGAHIEFYPQSNYYNLRYDRIAGGIFLRKYIPITNRFYFFGEGELKYSFFRMYNNTINKNTNQTRAYGLYLNAGAGFSITKRLSIELTANDIGHAEFYRENSIYGTPSLQQGMRYRLPVIPTKLSIGVKYKF